MDVQKRKRKKINNNKNTFFQEYNFELLVLGLFGLGFFLLWEDWDIRKNAWIFITTTAQFFVTFLGDISFNIGKIFKKYGKPSDIIGIVLILIAMILVLNRARIRIIRNQLEKIVTMSKLAKNYDPDLKAKIAEFKHGLPDECFEFDSK